MELQDRYSVYRSGPIHCCHGRDFVKPRRLNTSWREVNYSVVGRINVESLYTWVVSLVPDCTDRLT